MTALLETTGIQRLILDIAIRSMAELTKRACNWEIHRAQDILNAVFSNSSQCFYSINHPSPFLLELVSDCICDTLGLSKTRLDEKTLFDACHPKICENYIFYWNASKLVLNGNSVPSNLSSPDMPYMIELRGGTTVTLRTVYDVYLSFVRGANPPALQSLDQKLTNLFNRDFMDLSGLVEGNK